MRQTNDVVMWGQMRSVVCESRLKTYFCDSHNSEPCKDDS